MSKNTLKVTITYVDGTVDCFYAENTGKRDGDDCIYWVDSELGILTEIPVRQIKRIVEQDLDEQ